MERNGDRPQPRAPRDPIDPRPPRDPSDRREPREEGELLPGLDSVPMAARIAAAAGYRTALWGIAATLDTAQRISEAAGSMVGLAEDVAARQVDEAVEAVRPPRDRPQQGRDEGVQTLRERGADLLDRAADVDEGRNPIHPGFARIIDQLAPDEARILKLLINEGPRGIVYVNKAAPFGIGARELARRLSMIGHEAGLLHNELVPAYLDNLVSHGLIAIRRDALEDELPYQVIEAQPEVVAALANGGKLLRGQITRRSVHLTDFGRTFCQVCFPPEHLTGEFGAIEVNGKVVAVSPPEPLID